MTRDGDQRQGARPLARFLDKPPAAWKRRDLLKLCQERGIRVVNFRYPSLDGKLRELRLPASDSTYLDRLLAAGERVDGSSLFPGLFETTDSDLYVVPVYRWAYLNPFAEDELDIVCRFADRDGGPCSRTPDNVLAAAAERLSSSTGMRLDALAELEFYMILQRDDERFTGKAQRNYHQSAPYLHGRPVADEILRLASQICGGVKYSHSEVGYIDRLESDDPEIDGCRVEQYELELDLMPIQDLATWVTVIRWLIRVVADRHGASVTYVPKLDEGMAGSGMHLHLALDERGINRMRGADGELSSEALGLVGGLLRQAVPITAFGNTVAASYLRLVPGQEAPTRVCWGLRDRSSLIRVPLDFRTETRLDRTMNPAEDGPYPKEIARPTVEYRSPDGSAFAHLLLAAVTLAAEDGLLDPQAVELARRLEAGAEGPEADLGRLPSSAAGAAASLRQGRAFFEERGIPSQLVDIVASKLAAEADEDLAQRLLSLPAAERIRLSRRLMHKDIHKH